ncbi:MAG: patatin-like phospholipase family protein [Prolixibacteraceae bacterium]
MKIVNQYNTGLVLSGGAARGFAHIGVLKAMHELNFIPDVVSGVSAGSIVGAFYCDGYSPEEIFEIFSQRKLFDFVRLGFPKSGFLEMTGLKEVLKKNLRTRLLQDLRTPLWIAVTNYCSGKVEYLNSGSIIDAVIASSSIPIIFKPYKINGNYYIDGGITNNFPIEPIQEISSQLIGAFVNPIDTVNEPLGIFQTALRSFQLSISSKIHEKKKNTTVFIEPKLLRKFGLFDVNHGKEIFQIGYNEAKNVFGEKYE